MHVHRSHPRLRVKIVFFREHFVQFFVQARKIAFSRNDVHAKKSIDFLLEWFHVLKSLRLHADISPDDISLFLVFIGVPPLEFFLADSFNDIISTVFDIESYLIYYRCFSFSSFWVLTPFHKCPFQTPLELGTQA